MKISQAEMGRRAGVSKSAISQLELGMSKNLKPANLYKLEHSTGYRAEWVATGKLPRKTGITASFEKLSPEMALICNLLSSIPHKEIEEITSYLRMRIEMLKKRKSG